MALWEYKVITSGVHGFATPALLEAYLNSLGKDEWEIVNFQPNPTNPLAFTGVVRRSTQRDWVPPEIPAHSSIPSHAPAPKSANGDTHQAPAQNTSATAPTLEKPPALAAETETSATASTSPEQPLVKDSMRTVRDTERDLDPDAQDEDDADDEWDNLGIDEDLPTFFDALKPHMRNNQKGPGQSVAVDFLCKRWELPESDIVGALKECGLVIPETEDSEPQYFEFEDDLYWVNKSSRGQLFINTREKPRPKFRIAAAKPLSPDDPAYAELAAERADELARIEKRNAERAAQQAAAAARAEEAAKRRAEAAAANEAAAAETPAEPEAPAAAASAQTADEPETQNLKPDVTAENAALLERIRPLMRRNRHGPGYSGTVSFLARALKMEESALGAALEALQLRPPAAQGEKPVFVEISNALYWLNKDNRGNIWINGRELKNGHKKSAAQASAETPVAQSQTTAPAVAAETSAPTGPAPEPTEQPETPSAGISTAPATDDVSVQNPEVPAGQPASQTDGSPLSAVRLLLKPNKRGSGVSGEVGYLARTLGKNETEFVAMLTNAGLIVPPDADTKPTFVEHADEIFWFSFFEKDGQTSIWLNAKPSKKAKGGSKEKSERAPRSRKPKASKSDES